MLTEAHRASLKNMYDTYPVDHMLCILRDFLAYHGPQTSGPISRGECTVEEVAHCYLDIAGVPKDLTLKQRIAYHQIVGKP